jgi:hypothetical protein
MSTLLEDVLPTISDGWALVEDLGFSPYSIVVRSYTWSGGSVGLGSRIASDLALTPNPQVVERDCGRSLLVTGIVPSWGGGGYTVAQLKPAEGGVAEYEYVVTGPNGTHAYELTDIDTSDPVEYKLTLHSLTRTNPQ